MNHFDTVERLSEFLAYASLLTGDEKGEAQVFLDRLFKAFGHDGYKEAGATLEYRLKDGKQTKYPDLVWKPRLLLEMKAKGQKLSAHYKQAFAYWIQAVPNRPRYVVLCNFEEFWIYDFDLQVDEPVDKVSIGELPKRYSAFNFLFPTPKKPLFKNDLVAVTRAAADKVAAVFNSLVKRGEDRKKSQRFVLQCVMGLFSEDFGLLPKDLFTELIEECANGSSSYDLLGSLFRQMNEPLQAKGGRYRDVRYFNGGLFAQIDPVELTSYEVQLLREASFEDWAKVRPPIFGTLFQSSMDKKERHAYGAHFTSEADISKIVSVTIEKPWAERLSSAKTLKDFVDLKRGLSQYQVLDPACGSGNFLYLAYLQLRRLENEVLFTAHAAYGKNAAKQMSVIPSVSPFQFHGLDNNQFAVELAKVTLLLAKEIAIRETASKFIGAQEHLIEKDLPLENLDGNIRCDDALFCKWPKVDAIIGNPPYQSKNKIVKELSRDYVEKVRAKYPGVPGRADYCVYWFRRAHDELGPNGRAGLVGTNTIRQNFSRVGGLDYIVANGGTITEAVSSQVWSGEAAVHVSIVNWTKGKQVGDKRLFVQKGDRLDSPWELHRVKKINAALSPYFDVTGAQSLQPYERSEYCCQGQTHGQEGFLVSLEEADEFRHDPAAAAVIHPYLIGDDILGHPASAPSRCVIDLNHCSDVTAAMSHGKASSRVKEKVLPVIQKNAEDELNKQKIVNGPRQQKLKHWWKFWRSRPEIMDKIAGLPRYVVCVRVTKRPIFEFVDCEVHPNDSLQVFGFADDYSFGILQSDVHWRWFSAKCSTLKADPRYTSESIFATFVWPQNPTKALVAGVAESARHLRVVRRKIMQENKWTLRALYKMLELPGDNDLRAAHEALDEAVREAYGWNAEVDSLESLLQLNLWAAKQLELGKTIRGAGLLSSSGDPQFISGDRITSKGHVVNAPIAISSFA